jgi:N6-adenosine-specific RNA methylase IME4
MTNFEHAKTADKRIVRVPKLHFGMGRYVRMCDEKCIIAARGKAASLIKNHSVRSVFFAPVPRDKKGKIIHSAKPPEFYDIIETLCGGPRLELFAREGRVGWTCAGNEIGVVKKRDLSGVGATFAEMVGMSNMVVEDFSTTAEEAGDFSRAAREFDRRRAR